MSSFPPDQRDALSRVISARRDVRSGFSPRPVPDDVLHRMLAAAHAAPSVGFSQPWDFMVVRDHGIRTQVRDLVLAARDYYAAQLPWPRAQRFRDLKVESILDTPLNIVVTSDPTRGGRHTLGRATQPKMSAYSTCLAVENLGLPA
jgi:nicotinate-nucleotide--dimethylbenzimidazole phosphoribosyltransferase